MMSLSRVLICIVVTPVLIAMTGSAVYLWLKRHDPVLYRNVDRASVTHSAFVILNPFRDGEPESLAENVLVGLKARDCQRALSLRSLTADTVIYLCEREQKYPLENWSLMDYEVDGEKLTLIYNTYRNVGNDKIRGAPAWINVEKVDGRWQATGYETYY